MSNTSNCVSPAASICFAVEIARLSAVTMLNDTPTSVELRIPNAHCELVQRDVRFPCGADVQGEVRRPLHTRLDDQRAFVGDLLDGRSMPFEDQTEVGIGG